MEILPTTVQLEWVSVRSPSCVLRIVSSLDVAFYQQQFMKLQLTTTTQLQVALLIRLQLQLELQLQLYHQLQQGKCSCPAIIHQEKVMK